MKRPLDAIILIAAKLKEKERTEEEIWKVLREFGKAAKLSPRELDSLFTAVAILRDIPQEAIEQEAPTIIKDYLSTEEGEKLNGFVIENI